MATQDHNLMASMLVLMLSFVVVMGIFLVYLVLRWRHVRLTTPAESRSFEELATALAIKGPRLGLKRPNCWLAIQNSDLLAVQSALALHNPKPCSWSEGLSGEGESKLFVSPPVSGWVLVMGPALPDPGEDVDVCFRFLLELSRKVGQVQFFNENGMLNEHAWVRAESGRILRGYAWAGKTLWNQGSVTAAEVELGMKCYDYAEPEPKAFGLGEPGVNNADKVHLLASRWSVDPDTIDERLIEQELGIVGQPSRWF
ncbi:MAG TPA: hypothetical protein VH413_12050 [Verrucomicrobiae bacterium]|jgi:hypothetical protein|nr:hypothetical protein [Verrucomicrobiae bacterium]